MLELDWLALGVAVKYQLALDNSPQSTLMWKRHQAFSTHRITLMIERLIKIPIRYYFDNNMERVKARHDEYDPATKTTRTKVVETLCNED